jgi:uncharacterized membrane protein
MVVVVAAVVGQVQAVRVAQAVVETAVVMHPPQEVLEQLTSVVAEAEAALMALAGQIQVVRVVQALQLCKFKHRCTQVLQLDRLLLRLQVDLQL